MTLTTVQIEARRGKLTASRIAPLMTGDRDKIMQLYLEMIGEGEPEDLSAVWPVRLGEITEPLNLEWYERQGNLIGRRGEVVVHPRHTWAAATLDAWDLTLRCPVETKHVGGREPIEVIIDRYQPQMQWQMECTGAVMCALSVIMGASKPIVEYIDRDEAYAAEMVVRGRQFMDCVVALRPPVALEPVKPPCDPTKLIDMTGNNQWAHNAGVWLETRASASICKDAEKVLKSMVPEDAKKCFGHEIQITRDRAGRLSLRDSI